METATYRITLAGRVNDPNFHKCVACLKFLEQDNPKAVQITILQFFETQWEEYLKKIQNEKKGSFFHHKQSPIVFYNETNYIGDVDAFSEWALDQFRYLDKTRPIIYQKKAADTMKQLIENTPGRQYVYMDIDIGGQTQKVIIELFTEFAPNTCENFRKLCSGIFTNKQGEKLSYVGCEFHRVVKGMYIQGGDLYKNGIKNNASIYEGEFADESFHIKHTEIGLIGMAKRKAYSHSNECQFYVTTAAPLSFLDDKYVVFARVISGMRAFKMIEKQDIINEKPVQAVTIKAAGDYHISQPLPKKLTSKDTN